MTKEDIIRMAMEALWPKQKILNDLPEISRFANLVASAVGDQQYALGHLDGLAAGIREGSEAEREACAKVCEDMEDKYWRSIQFEIEWTPVDCADAIRARGETK